MLNHVWHRLDHDPMIKSVNLVRVSSDSLYSLIFLIISSAHRFIANNIMNVYKYGNVTKTFHLHVLHISAAVIF